MSDGRVADQWERTAWLMCQQANLWRDSKSQSRPFEPWEFNPLDERNIRHAAMMEKIDWMELYLADVFGPERRKSDETK